MGGLRVLYVLGHGGLGGIERHVQALVHGLSPTGIDAHLCVLMQPGEVSEAMKREGVPVHVLGARHGHAPGLLSLFCRLLRDVRPDIVHFHELHFLPALAMRLFPHIPLIYSEHCSIPDAPNLSATRALWAAVGHRIDRILPVSRYTGRMLTEYLGVSAGRMTVVYNGLDVEGLNAKRPSGGRVPRGAGEGARVVGGVGRLAAQKDWKVFLEAAKCLSLMRGDVQFAIVGDGPLRRPLEQTANRLGIADRIHWLGFREDTSDLLRGFDVFLFTSMHEELPTTLLEVFALRTPVAGFVPKGGTSEILELCNSPPGVFLEQRSPRPLANAVNDLLNDPRRADAMTEEGFRVVREHFNMRAIAAQVKGIYDASLNGKGAASL